MNPVKIWKIKGPVVRFIIDEVYEGFPQTYHLFGPKLYISHKQYQACDSYDMDTLQESSALELLVIFGVSVDEVCRAGRKMEVGKWGEFIKRGEA